MKLSTLPPARYVGRRSACLRLGTAGTRTPVLCARSSGRAGCVEFVGWKGGQLEAMSDGSGYGRGGWSVERIFSVSKTRSCIVHSLYVVDA